ncbi:MAG: hypothetical protein N2Z20_04200 [Elusimicrobiales bacterium]|nr:hypothetical protein [Elusimicrobiales bacterium]
MKIEKVFLKTGVTKKDIKLLKLSFAGLITLISSFFSSCSKNEFKQSQTVISTHTYQTQPTTSDVKNIADTPPNFKQKNCGPTPGYPCGTKYFTVSIFDICRG